MPLPARFAPILLSLALGAVPLASAGAHVTAVQGTHVTEVPSTPLSGLVGYRIACRVHHPEASPLVTLTNTGTLTVKRNGVIHYEIQPANISSSIPLATRLRPGQVYQVILSSWIPAGEHCHAHVVP